MATDQVHLTITQLDLPGATFPTGRITHLDTHTSHLTTAAEAWAREHVLNDLHSLIKGLHNTFNPTPPAAGFAALINRPTGLLFLAQWAWCANLPDEIRTLLDQPPTDTNPSRL